MNRYVFYHYFIICFTNLMLLIPFFLISERFDGAVMAILISPIIGMIMFYLNTSGLKAFPSKGYPEIFSLFYPQWLVRIVMSYKALIFASTGAIVISSYAVIITRFLNPEGNPYIILAVLMLVCAFGATRSTVTVNFILEITMIINTPLIGFIIYKTMSNPLMNWDAVTIVAKHYDKLPSILALASAMFVFSGFMNLGIFHRVFPLNFRFKYRWLFVIVAFIDLAFIFLIPIGIHGTEAVSHYVYLWTATADSTKMMFGFIERLIFIFLIVLINLSLSFTIVGWHMVVEYIKSLFPNNIIDPDESKPTKRAYIIMAVLLIVTFTTLYITDELSIINIAAITLICRMFSEVFVTCWIYYLSKKKVRKYEKVST